MPESVHGTCNVYLEFGVSYSCCAHAIVKRPTVFMIVQHANPHARKRHSAITMPTIAMPAMPGFVCDICINALLRIDWEQH